MFCIFFLSPYQRLSAVDEDTGPYFSISILAPNTSLARNQWASLMVELLPSIGIGVDVFDYTGWNKISPRTWGYPGPYPVPTYAEGGFDILFVSWSWGLDWDPTGLYDSPAITPNGDNFYQYSNPAMDQAIESYTSSFLLEDKITYCKTIQALLYEDLPQISLIYPVSVYPHQENVNNFEGLLWANEYYPFHEMTIENQTTFHYATPADFEDFHIHTYESPYDAQWLHQIYNGLLERDPNLGNGYGPWLAESVSSTDGLAYHVKIKNEACWADGTALTTDDIIYNYQLAVTPALGGTGYSNNVLYWDNDSITKINDKEFTIEFLQKYVFQDGNLALDLIPEHIWGAIDPADHQTTVVTWVEDNPERILGAGPYMLENYNGTTGIIHLVANPHFVDWFGAEPSFEDIYFEFYSNKDGALSALASDVIDMVDAQFSPRLEELNISGLSYTLVDDPGTQEMGINMMHPYLGTGELCPIAGAESAKHIRKAISHLVPREIICEDILNGLGIPATTGCPITAVGYDSSLLPYEYDINMAKYHMAQAGFDIDWSPYDVINFDTKLAIGLSITIIVLVFALLVGGLIFSNKKS